MDLKIKFNISKVQNIIQTSNLFKNIYLEILIKINKKEIIYFKVKLVLLIVKIMSKNKKKLNNFQMLAFNFKNN